MDPTRRRITKIARQADKLVIRTLRSGDIGSAEFDLLDLVRKHPGISQKKICEELNADKGGTARRVANLEAKGYLMREKNPEDGRGQMLFPTEKAAEAKHSRAHIEAEFYQWLLSELPEDELNTFAATLQKLNRRADEEAEAGFPHVIPNI